MTVTAEMVRRRIIFDCMADPQKAAILVGMVGTSVEGAQKEEEESCRRLVEIMPVLPMITTFSEWLAEVAMEFHLAAVDPENVPEEFRDHMAGMFFSIIQGSVTATVSVLNDLGMITVPPEGANDG